MTTYKAVAVLDLLEVNVEGLELIFVLVQREREVTVTAFKQWQSQISLKGMLKLQ